MGDEAIDRRIGKIESTVDIIPSVVAKLHSYGNTLQLHTLHIDAIIGPKDSLLIDVGKMKGSIQLIEERLKNIDSGLSDIKKDMNHLIRSTEIARADTAGQWQLRATMVTAVVASLSALAVAALQFG